MSKSKMPTLKPTALLFTGCTKFTCEDMWRLVWQEKCHRIVMTTNLIERGKVDELQSDINFNNCVVETVQL